LEEVEPEYKNESSIVPVLETTVLNVGSEEFNQFSVEIEKALKEIDPGSRWHPMPEDSKYTGLLGLLHWRFNGFNLVAADYGSKERKMKVTLGPGIDIKGVVIEGKFQLCLPGPARQPPFGI
jgi:hypothetical protein